MHIPAPMHTSTHGMTPYCVGSGRKLSDGLSFSVLQVREDGGECVRR